MPSVDHVFVGTAFALLLLLVGMIRASYWWFDWCSSEQPSSKPIDAPYQPDQNWAHYDEDPRTDAYLGRIGQEISEPAVHIVEVLEAI